jgi:hypothetical protein
VLIIRLKYGIIDTQDLNVEVIDPTNRKDVEECITYYSQTEVGRLLKKGVKIIGLRQKGDFYIDEKYLEKDFTDCTFYLMSEFHKFTHYILLGTTERVYLFDLCEDKYISNIDKLRDTIINNIAINKDILSINYSFENTHFFVYNGIVDYQIKDKNIKLYSNIVKQIDKGEIVGYNKLPVTQLYAEELLKSIGIPVKPSYNTHYELVENRLCVVIVVGMEFYYIDKGIIYHKENGKIRCICKGV